VITAGAITAVTVLNGGYGYLPGDTIVFTDPGSKGIAGATLVAGGANYRAGDLAWAIADATGSGGLITLGLVANAVIVIGVGAAGKNYTSPVVVISSASGSGGAVSLTLSAATVGSGATATFTLQNDNNYPGCSAYFVQRQWYAGSAAKPENFWASKIAAFNNFTKATPIQASDAISATIASTQVNAIKSLVPMPSGLIALTSGGAFLISGGSVGAGGIPAAVTPSSITAQPQASNGASDLPPIVINYDVVFGQQKGSIVRDLSYNFYVNIYTGTDLTVMSNHLFTNHTLREWAYAEEPYKIIWCVRSDGILLSLTYLKQEEVFGWTRHDTAGQFQSVCTVSEGTVDATYFVVRRFLNGAWCYTIERMADRALVDGNAELGQPANILNAWCVDCGLSYAGAPVTTVAGLGHLNGQTVAILADGNVVTPQVVSGGAISLAQPASHVVVGLPYTCQLRTLAIDVGENTPGGSKQGQLKKVGAVTVLVKDSRGIKAGRTLNTLVPVKEWNSNVPLGGPLPLVTGQQRIIMDPAYDDQGQYWLTVSDPVPATVLGVVPEVTWGS
jgi:hypothetical protein